MLRPPGLDRAKVAAVRDYVVQANWELVWENNRECGHYNANHPQYVKANYDHAPIDDARIQAEAAAIARETSERLRAHGLTISVTGPAAETP